MKKVLLEQVAAIESGHTPAAFMNFSKEIRIEPRRVYWSCVAWAGASDGLVYDPTRKIRTDTHAFGERVIGVSHLSGHWYVCNFT